MCLLDSEAGRASDAAEERVAAMESSGHPVSENDIAMTLRRQFSMEGKDAAARVVELKQQLRKEREQKVKCMTLCFSGYFLCLSL